MRLREAARSQGSNAGGIHATKSPAKDPHARSPPLPERASGRSLSPAHRFTPCSARRKGARRAGEKGARAPRPCGHPVARSSRQADPLEEVARPSLPRLSQERPPGALRSLLLVRRRLSDRLGEAAVGRFDSELSTRKLPSRPVLRLVVLGFSSDRLKYRPCPVGGGMGAFV